MGNVVCLFGVKVINLLNKAFTLLIGDNVAIHVQEIWSLGKPLSQESGMLGTDGKIERQEGMILLPRELKG